MADSSQGGVPPGPPEVPGPNEAARRAIGVRVLVVLGVVLALLMVVFGRATVKGYDEFEAYKSSTLEDPNNPPRWETEALDVDGCVDEALAWIEACPGVSSWCEASLSNVMRQCLATQDRSEYCESVGDAVLSTRFGFEECSARYDQIEGRYARRYAKKHCSLIYRVIADSCTPGGA
ncbi:hypothetical protein ENSA5_51580 [Enhygromyxa salina]|uniref:Uncharacterized protein n=1 Tax=Enhygromyxa salina TaxID=215803 RepID=A0A2S9XGQ6_9BACT|nr:hypothetical protein [Enhygromyxa salina]PRP92064.1 hypothetical protein ENSA5_51580 [Enhygromyxa salina]